MKIAKSISLFIVGLHATVLLHAQEIKTVLLKQEEIKLPPAPESAAPTPVTEFKPMNGVVPKASPVLEKETPSPYNKDKNTKPSKTVSTITAEKPVELTKEPGPKE